MIPRSPHLYDGGSVAVWLLPPNVVFTQVRSRRYTVSQAETFVGAIWSRAAAELGAGRYVWVSDSRAITSYETGSRLLLTRWSLDHREELDRIVLIVSPGHRLVVAGVRVACLASSTVGIPAFVESSPEALLERHGIELPSDFRCPDPGTLAPAGADAQASAGGRVVPIRRLP